MVVKDFFASFCFLSNDTHINGRPQTRTAVLHLVQRLAYFAPAGKTNVLGVLLAE